MGATVGLDEGQAVFRRRRRQANAASRSGQV